MNQESKLFTILKWVIGGLIAYAASFIVMDIVKGIVGVLIACAIAFIAIQAWPLFQFAVKNLVLEGWKFIARESPITSMQNIEIEKQKELRLYRDETVTIETETNAFRRMVEEVEENYPGDPETVRLREQLQMLELAVSERRRHEGEAEKALFAFNQTIRKMEMMWNASQAGLKASKRAKMSKKDYEKLVLQTSMNAVHQSMDRCFAQLKADTAKIEQQRAALPPAQKRSVIPITVVENSKTPARR